MTEEAFSPEQQTQLKALVKEAMREELKEAGLWLETPGQQENAREDFRFLRTFRKAFNGTASKIGTALLLALVSGFVFLVMTGLNFWKAH